MDQNNMQGVDQENVLMAGKNFSILGDILGAGLVIISGKVEGNITAAKVILASNSLVIGNITCDELDVSGEFQGLAKVKSVIIRKNALVKGEVNYLTIAMEQGSEVLGKLKKSDDKKSSILGKFANQNVVGGVQRPPMPKVVVLPFPDELHPKLTNPELRSKIKLAMIDGTQTPYWVNLTSDRLRIAVGNNEVEALKDRGESIQLRLHIDGDMFDFNLPE